MEWNRYLLLFLILTLLSTSVFASDLTIDKGFRYADICTENYCFVLDNGIMKDVQNILKCVHSYECEDIVTTLENLHSDNFFFPFHKTKIYIIELGQNAGGGLQ
jgi:hypothetical protein